MINAATPAKAKTASPHPPPAFEFFLGRIFGQADPDTRALQEELGDVENQILAAGQRYNHRVMALNIRTGRFPWSLISRPTGFRPVEYFVLDERPARQ